MKAKNVILGLGGLSVLGAGFYFYKQYQIASEVDFDFKNFKIDGASANNAVIAMDIVVDNKTLTLLPKKSVSSVPLSINVNLSALGTSVSSIISNLNDARNAEISIKGSMDFGSGLIRVSNYKFDYRENLASLILQSI